MDIHKSKAAVVNNVTCYVIFRSEIAEQSGDVARSISGPIFTRYYGFLFTFQFQSFHGYIPVMIVNIVSSDGVYDVNMVWF